MPLIELTFRAVDDAHVCDAHALLTAARPPQDGEVRRFIGKTWSDEEGRHVVSEPTTLRVSPVELVQLRKHYAEAVRDGHLECVDEKTAAAIGVPFKTPSPQPPPAPAARPSLSPAPKVEG